MNFTANHCYQIFTEAIRDYHKLDDINQPLKNPYDEKNQTIDYLLYLKNWIDTVQWHYEDIVRAPDIDPVDALDLKRKIDASNQRRNDTVEKIDDWMLQFLFQNAQPKENARLNSESPAWVVDRLSIIALKIYHMEIEANRTEATPEHRQNCRTKLNILNEQKNDLSQCLDELIEEIQSGRGYMKVYRQMKMYNDPSLNPVLYQGTRKE